MKHAISLGFLLTCVSPLFLPGGFWNRYWYGPWAVLIAFAILSFAFYVGNRLHWTLVPFTLSTLLSSLWVYGWFGNDYTGWAVGDQAALKSSSLYASLAFVLLLLACVRLKDYTEHLRKLLGVVCLLATIWTLCQFQSIPFKRVGFAGNASMNGCLIAVTLPFMLSALLKVRSANVIVPILTCLAAIAVSMTSTSVPVGVLCVVLLTLYLSKFTILLVAFIAAIECSLQGSAAFFSPSDRFSMWRVFMEWWWYATDHLFGAGAGVSTVLLPSIQKARGMNGNFFMWFHSDPLQVLFEQGAIGAVTLFVAFVGVAWKSRRDRALLASVLGFAAASVFNYPTHLAPHALVGISLLAMAYKRTEGDRLNANHPRANHP